MPMGGGGVATPDFEHNMSWEGLVPWFLVKTVSPFKYRSGALGG